MFIIQFILEKDKPDKDSTNLEGEKYDRVKVKLYEVNRCEGYRTENDTTDR